MEYLLAFMSFKILVQVQYKFYTIQLYTGETYPNMIFLFYTFS